jgi:predicted outer membrane repeat protein
MVILFGKSSRNDYINNERNEAEVKMRRRTIFLLTLFIIALQIYCANPRRYITQNGSGLRDGSSWENAGAAEDLQDILNTIEDADFWIAKGTYKPNRFFTDPEDSRNMTISAHHNFIYGGFAGNETELSQRDIKVNETIFSGDIGIEGDNSDNSYHVMRAAQILDGVTICYGNANGLSDPDYYGGGVYVWGSNSVFRNCTFRDNYASSRGGAVLMDTWGYDVVFENCLFYDNESQYGGAIYSRYDLTTINNCTFVNNTAENGGGIYIVETDESKFLITNNIFWLNSVNHIRIYNSANFSYTVSHNAIEGGYEGFANINLSSNNTGDPSSPYFTDPDNHDYSLQPMSQCVDAGAFWNASCVTDITGQLRPQGSGWDIGAYEYNSGPLTAVPPSVSTLSPEFITVSTARVRGNLTDDGGSQMITKGVYYGTTSGFDPETEGTFVKYNELYSEGEFYIDITDLSPGRYYYRIFCENRVGSAIGEEMMLTVYCMSRLTEPETAHHGRTLFTGMTSSSVLTNLL